MGDLKVFSFDVVLRGEGILDEDAAEALYEAGCDDSTSCMDAGVPVVSFDRKAESLEEAVLSAIRDIRGSKILFEVVEVRQVVTSPDIERVLTGDADLLS